MCRDEVDRNVVRDVRVDIRQVYNLLHLLCLRNMRKDCTAFLRILHLLEGKLVTCCIRKEVTNYLE